MSSRDDMTPPVTVAVFNPQGWNGFWQPGVTMTLNATDNESGVNVTYFRCNNGSWQVYSEGIVFVIEGVTVVQFYSVDNAGNIEDVKQVEVKIDGTPPIVSASDPPWPNGQHGWYISNVTVTLTAVDPILAGSTTPGSGVKELWWRYSPNHEWQPYTGPFNISQYHPSFETYCKDNVGNKVYGKPISLKFDQTPPEITLFREKIVNNLVFVAKAVDRESGVNYVEFHLMGGHCYTDTEAPFEWIDSLNENITVEAIAYNYAGLSASDDTPEAPTVIVHVTVWATDPNSNWSAPLEGARVHVFLLDLLPRLLRDPAAGSGYTNTAGLCDVTLAGSTQHTWHYLITVSKPGYWPYLLYSRSQALLPINIYTENEVFLILKTSLFLHA